MLNAPPLRRRLACLVYEGLILLGVALFTAAMVVLIGPLTRVESNPHLLRPVMQGAEFVVLTAYGTWFWSAGRQTLPMKTWHIRVVTSTGAPLSAGRALWRAVLSWLWLMPSLALSAAFHLSPQDTGLLLCAGLLLWAFASLLRTDRQYLHDALAGTRLVSVPR
jgi:uncharacterized RDD family membrane protein YckC